MANRKTIETQKGVTVFIPRENKHDDALFVAVNGQRLLVKKGEPVTLPQRFAEAVENSFRAQREAESYIDTMTGDR